MSPVRFVQEVRLEQATYLFRTTSQTPDAIAAAVGYAGAGTSARWCAAAGTPHWPPCGAFDQQITSNHLESHPRQVAAG